MSLARRTFHSAAWNLSTNLGSRVVTVVGTLFLTRYLAPDAYGEVIVAATVVLTANQLVNLGVGHYVVSKPTADREVVFHATAYYLVTGVAVTVLILALRNRFGVLFDAPHMGRFVPGLALALLIDRIVFMPEKMLIREMRFRRVGVIRSLGEITYTLVSLALAAAGWGGQSIVAGNVARSLLRGIAVVGSTERRAWLSPCRLNWAVTSEIFAFALPMWLSTAAASAARRWDSLLVARLFGPASAGLYNLAYSLAEIPALHVGEPVGDVLLPSFAQVTPSRRPEALIRSTGLLALAVFPMAVGLGTIAPMLVSALLDPQWRAIGPMLAVLCAVSVARPISTMVASYLQAQNRPWSLLKLQCLTVALLLVLIATLGRLGPLWVCAAAGLSAGVYSLASLFTVNRFDRIPLTQILAVLSGPFAACIPMIAAILVSRTALYGIAPRPGIALVIEILVGAATYVGAVFLLAPSPVREMLRLASDAVGLRLAPDRSR